jgi:hypothetical protein
MAMGRFSGPKLLTTGGTVARSVERRRDLYLQMESVLDAAEFDTYVEYRCRSLYAKTRGRPSLPPSIYIRMQVVLHIELLESEEELLRLCEKSPIVRNFLGLKDRSIPSKSWLLRVRLRIPRELREELCHVVLKLVFKQIRVNALYPLSIRAEIL